MTATDSRDEQRQRVLDTAAGLFAERGFDEVTMAEIAEGAAVARATVFNYFGSKHALIEAITDTVLDFYRAMLDEALADEATPTPLLMRKLCDDMAAGIESQRSLFRGVFREIARIQLGLDAGEVAQRANEDAASRLLRLIERGQERGELTDALSAEALASAFHSLTNGTITNWLYQDPTRPLTVRMRDAAEVFLSSIELPRRRARPKGVRK
jgi:TetR/AcrR family transcriptional regulator of autoinduction and epiphytic fitness